MTLADDLDALPFGEPVPVAPGVLVARRCFMATAVAAFAAAGLPGQDSRPRVDPARDRLTYEDFLARAIPAVKELVRDTSRAGQDRYLRTLAACAAALADVPVPEMKSNGRTAIGANPGGDPFVVLHWQMERSAEIRPHPHIYGNVMTLGLAGEVRVTNWEMVETRDYDTREPFRVRRTQDQWLRPGDVNLVNLETGYVHGFRTAGVAARGLDITTRIREKRPTPTLVVTGDAVSDTDGTVMARWQHG